MNRQTKLKSTRQAGNGVSLKVQGLSKSFATAAGPKKVLSDISLVVNEGEWVTIMGRSGSGKSTLLKCVSGLMDWDSGIIETAGMDLNSLTEDQRTKMRRNEIGFIFQDYNLIEALTARQNIVLPLLLANDDSHQDETVNDALNSTKIADLADQRAFTLSGGEQQRVAISRALVQRPSILFADEPTGSLDTRNANLVLGLFKKLTSQASSV